MIIHYLLLNRLDSTAAHECIAANIHKFAKRQGLFIDLIGQFARRRQDLTEKLDLKLMFVFECAYKCIYTDNFTQNCMYVY